MLFRLKMINDSPDQWIRHDPQSVTSLIDQHFPRLREAIGNYSIAQLDQASATWRLPVVHKIIRPSVTIWVSMMFGLVDVAAWNVFLNEHGPSAIKPVTSSMTINFLARPERTDLICDAKASRKKTTSCHRLPHSIGRHLYLNCTSHLQLRFTKAIEWVGIIR